MSHGRDYLPAAGRDWALPLYDRLLRLLGMDAIHRPLLTPEVSGAARRVLDVGCGTGTLAVMLKRRYPSIEVTGLDPDPKALALASAKAARAAVRVHFVEGFADALPFGAGGFDRVFSTLMFHHVPEGSKAAMLGEVARVLAPGGALHLVDMEISERPRFPAVLLRHHLAGNTEGRILAHLRQSSLSGAEKVGSISILLGLARAGHYRASTPDPAHH